MEDCNIVQEVVTRMIRKKRKCKKAKRLSEEAFQIAEKIEIQRRKGKIYLTECRVPEQGEIRRP